MLRVSSLHWDNVTMHFECHNLQMLLMLQRGTQRPADKLAGPDLFLAVATKGHGLLNSVRTSG